MLRKTKKGGRVFIISDLSEEEIKKIQKIDLLIGGPIESKEDDEDKNSSS